MGRWVRWHRNPAVRQGGSEDSPLGPSPDPPSAVLRTGFAKARRAARPPRRRSERQRKGDQPVAPTPARSGTRRRPGLSLAFGGDFACRPPHSRQSFSFLRRRLCCHPERQQRPSEARRPAREGIWVVRGGGSDGTETYPGSAGLRNSPLGPTPDSAPAGSGQAWRTTLSPSTDVLAGRNDRGARPPDPPPVTTQIPLRQAQDRLRGQRYRLRRMVWPLRMKAGSVPYMNS